MDLMDRSITIKVPWELKAFLQADAQRQGCSVSDVIRRVLLSYARTKELGR